jgi:CDGSH-type Zn-finger protein
MAATRITVRDNGSLRVEGDFEIVDHEGRSFGLAGRAHVSLCRCGQSDNKPFCDGTHRKCGFRSQVTAFDLAPPAPKPET